MKYGNVVKEIKRKLKPLELEYESYENFEKRKQSDKSINLIIRKFMQKFMDNIAEIQNIALQSQMIMIWNDLDILVNQIKDIGIQLDATDYGVGSGSTFFITNKKDKDTFQILLESELTILDLMNELEIRLINYKDAIDSALLGNSSKIISEISKLLKQIINLWVIRQDAIKSYRFIS